MTARQFHLKSNILLLIVLAYTLTIILPQLTHAMYDPKHGRWLQRDPLGVRVDIRGRINSIRHYNDGVNLYKYAASNPTNMMDAFGTICHMDKIPGTSNIYGITNPLIFLNEYINGHGGEFRLNEYEANAVMQADGVRNEIENAVLKARYKAKSLKCNPQLINSKVIKFPVSGSAIAKGDFRVIIQQFGFKGRAECAILKKCCCANCDEYQRIEASCAIHFWARDTYDFHVNTLTWIPGKPYDIVWSWDSPKVKAYCERKKEICVKRCLECSR